METNVYFESKPLWQSLIYIDDDNIDKDWVVKMKAPIHVKWYKMVVNTYRHSKVVFPLYVQVDEWVIHTNCDIESLQFIRWIVRKNWHQ